jgi:hypothetical protein
MKKFLLILLLLLNFLAGCKKHDTPLSGTVTIDNNLYGTGPYYAYGFSFVMAKTLSTLDKNPAPDISVDNGDIPGVLILQANNYLESFYKEGEYPDAATAEQAFKNLASAQVTQWKAMGEQIKSNQIWIYRSGTENYTKFRIISTKYETRIPRDFVECTFEWVYQPDGSLTFPVK